MIPSSFSSHKYIELVQQSVIMQACKSICFNSRLNDDRRLSSDVIVVDKQFRKCDLIVFGASGSVGQFVIEELAFVLERSNSNLKRLSQEHQNEHPHHQQRQNHHQIIALSHQDPTTSLAPQPPQDDGAMTAGGAQQRSIGNKPRERPMRWAVAGRSANRLREALTRAELVTSIRGLSSDVPIVLADLEQHSSLLEMCAQTQLLVNCAGPYTHHGEAVIRACLETGTHYVDVSFETTFLELMQLKYFELAKERNIHIVGACGFQSMASEMGMNYIKKMHPGKLLGADFVLSVSVNRRNSSRRASITGLARGSRGVVSRGLWLSAVEELGQRYTNRGLLSLAEIRHNLTKQVLPIALNMASRTEMPDKYAVTKFAEVKGFCLPWHRASPDSSNLLRSEIYKYNNHKTETFVKSRTFVNLGTLLNLILALLMVSLFNILARFSLGRYLMRALPAIISAGIVTTRNKLERKDLSHIRFAQTIIAYGWDNVDECTSSRLSRRLSVAQSDAKRILVARVSGPDPNYMANASFVVMAALTLLTERDRLPGRGGVLTPGAAFKDTMILKRLQTRNIKFELIRQF